jgi:hypothetical protein
MKCCVSQLIHVSEIPTAGIHCTAIAGDTIIIEEGLSRVISGRRGK